MSVKFSILIPTTPDREDFFKRIFKQVHDQAHGFCENKYLPYGNDTSVQIYRHSNAVCELISFCDDKKYSIGYKRNELLRLSQGQYVAFIDDDDEIGPQYFEHAITGISKGVDACGLTGIITEDGQNPKKFVHSFLYDHWFEKDGVYYRNNNHLNVVKRSIAIQMKFPETNMGEDHDYSKQLQRSGLIATEYWDQEEIIYYYEYRSNK
jgi:hypothetical protein